MVGMWNLVPTKFPAVHNFVVAAYHTAKGYSVLSS